jgi:hypothetical protein
MRIFAPLALTAILPLAAAAQSFPGRIDDALVGDWQCGETRAYITGLGSIELLGDGYRAGLYDAADGIFAIKWDDASRSDWGYETSSDSITLTPPDGPEYSCTARD